MSALSRLTRPLRSLPQLSPSRPKSLPQNFFTRLQTPSRSRPHRAYHPPPLPRRSHYDGNMKVLYTLMGVNISVFGYGLYLKTAAQQGHVAPFVKFVQNMTLNLEDFKAGRWWEAITSVFTHLSFGHIFGNMFSAWFLGGFLSSAPIITPARFLMIALGSGLAGSVVYLANRASVTSKTGQRDVQRGLGFSGAVMGLSTVAACLAPRAKIYLYGIIPMPLWAMVAGYALYDGYYLNDSRSTIGHAGHLGGLGFGLVYYVLRLRGLRF
ncbi:hypothetical protein NX059_003236 [Plenodomus lindquistii]|nr:hypothetical protein NX059_003236 [Plenodomus lindquistii]